MVQLIVGTLDSDQKGKGIDCLGGKRWHTGLPNGKFGLEGMGLVIRFVGNVCFNESI